MPHPLPERRLLVAILDRAGQDLSKGGDLARKARVWIFDWEAEDLDHSYTFPWVCSELDLDPFGIRATLSRLLAEGVNLAAKQSRVSASMVDWILTTEADSGPVLALIDL
jgi:predicted nucleotidyltransferase